MINHCALAETAPHLNMNSDVSITHRNKIKREINFITTTLKKTVSNVTKCKLNMKIIALSCVSPRHEGTPWYPVI